MARTREEDRRNREEARKKNREDESLSSQESIGPVKGGKRAANTFFSTLVRGDTMPGGPNEALTLREKRQFQGSSKSPLFFLADKKTKDKILAREAAEREMAKRRKQ